MIFPRWAVYLVISSYYKTFVVTLCATRVKFTTVAYPILPTSGGIHFFADTSSTIICGYLQQLWWVRNAFRTTEIAIEVQFGVLGAQALLKRSSAMILRQVTTFFSATGRTPSIYSGSTPCSDHFCLFCYWISILQSHIGFAIFPELGHNLCFPRQHISSIHLGFAMERTLAIRPMGSRSGYVTCGSDLSLSYFKLWAEGPTPAAFPTVLFAAFETWGKERILFRLPEQVTMIFYFYEGIL